ncbi:MAG: ABC transporter permease [Chloroflexi bacterium]|nr:ABC transporter permease [Chloroflexota bacterium]
MQLEQREELLQIDQPSFISRAYTKFRQWPYIPAAVLAILVFAALAAPVISPYDPVKGDLRAREKPPLFFGGTAEHLFGTDNQGRDIFSRIIHGARVSMSFAAVTMLLSVALGAVIGSISGYFGGHVDEALMRLVDLQNAIPFILAALVVVSVFGASFSTLLIIIAIFSWGPTARQIRGEILQLKQMDYVALARIAGASSPRIIFKHLLPGVTNTLIVVATLGTGQIILTEATLSFLGVGIPPPKPAWGSMVSFGRNYIDSAWWIAVIPGLAIALVVVSLNFLGDWLRDYFDPRLRQI